MLKWYASAQGPTMLFLAWVFHPTGGNMLLQLGRLREAMASYEAARLCDLLHAIQYILQAFHTHPQVGWIKKLVNSNLTKH